ncbi:MAG: AraC family transcriptional regulator [Bacteroidales bacterium]
MEYSLVQKSQNFIKKFFNIDIKDIINKVPLSQTFNNELLIIKMDGYSQLNKGELIHIDAFSLLIMFTGTLDININGKDYSINSKALINILDLHTVQNINRSTDFSAYHIIVSHKLMAEIMRGIKRLPITNFLECFDNPIIKIDDQEEELFKNILLNILSNISRKDHVYQRDIIKNELRSLILEVANIVVQKSNISNISKFVRKEDIIAKFVHLVNNNCKEEHSVNFYAQKLCVENKYLSRILKALNGKTANVWIDEAIIIQAKIMLKDTFIPIQQIADILHFSDQSSFGKFFKKYSGKTPANYRKNA